jgi:hypothetical protein
VSVDAGNRGPICLGTHRSTASNASMDHIKAWLISHEHEGLATAQNPPAVASDQSEILPLWKRGSWLAHARRAGVDDYYSSRSRFSRGPPPPEYEHRDSYPPSRSGTRPGTPARQPPSTTSGYNKIFPGRLIDLSNLHLPEQTVSVTEEFDRENGDVRYAALSYCWRAGETNMLTGKASNRPVLVLSKLAPTIQDAISTTRRLGLKYLWIDAFCIIQTSKEDKDKELKKMSDIYANAEFVIAATAASDSSESFVVQRNPLCVNPCLVGVRGYPGRGEWHKPNSFEGIYALPSRKYSHWAMDDLKFSRLASRGWVFQEERLARRILHFTDHQTILQCNLCHKRLTELDWENVVSWSQRSYFNLVRPDIVFTFYRLFWSLFWDYIVQSCSKSVPIPEWEPRQAVEQDVSTSFTIALRTAPTDRLRTEIWWDLVEAYSQRYLSVPSDKLPAISALATRLERQILDGGIWTIQKYWHGVYDSPTSFVPSLLWYVADGRSVRPAYRAPSWSWASVDGVIKNNSVHCTADPRKCGVKVVNGPSSRQGDPRIRIRGKLRLAMWRRLPSGASQYYIGHQRTLDIRHPQYHDQFTPVVRNPTAGPEAHALCGMDGSVVGFFVPDTDEDFELVSSSQVRFYRDLTLHEIYCLQIIVRPSDADAEEDFAIPWAARGLALIRSPSDETLYRRVGYIELSRDHPGMDTSQTWPGKAKNRRKRPFPEVDKHAFFTGLVEKTIEIC